MRRSIRIYGKENCDRCTKAKEKLDKLGLKYEYHLLAEILDEKNEKWRERVEEVIDLKAETCINGYSVPVLWIKDKGYLQYAPAMKAAKAIAKGN